MTLCIDIVEAKTFSNNKVVAANVERVEASGVSEDTADLAKQLCHNLEAAAQATIAAHFNGKGKGNAV